MLEEEAELPREKTLAYFFCFIGYEKQPGILLESRRYFDKYCASWKVFALRPKRWTKKVQKKFFHCAKKEVALFFPIMQNKAEAKEQSTAVHKDFQQLLCKF